MRRIVEAGLNLGTAVLLLAAMGVAEAPAGMMQSRGNVTINGKAVSESSNLFNGDRIQTSGPDSAANILANGQHMMVMGNSTVIYRDNNVTVECGGLLVTLPAGGTAHVNGITLHGSPDGSSARFEFHQSRGSYQITDREGSISYDDGTGEKSMVANQSDNHAGGGEACSRVAGPITNNPAPVQGGMGVGGISEKVAWAAGAGSAFAAICAVECRNRHHNVSPATP
jgi:hypothetical protein